MRLKSMQVKAYKSRYANMNARAIMRQEVIPPFGDDFLSTLLAVEVLDDEDPKA